MDGGDVMAIKGLTRHQYITLGETGMGEVDQIQYYHSVLDMLV